MLQTTINSCQCYGLHFHVKYRSVFYLKSCIFGSRCDDAVFEEEFTGKILLKNVSCDPPNADKCENVQNNKFCNIAVCNYRFS